MFQGLKDKYHGLVGKIISPKANSTFYQDGKLTLEEWQEACDKLVYVCPSWGWRKAIDKAHEYSELPADKQYLVTRITSNERAKNALENIEIVENGEDGWIEAKVKGDAKLKIDKTVMDQDAPEKPVEVKTKNLDDSDDEDENPPVTAKLETPKTAAPTSKDTRQYDISITYDKYYHTPRLWLSGVNNDGRPLTTNEIFEDIMSDYINKTVTISEHPHLGTQQASIHPCKHAEVIHQLVSEAKSNGVEINHDQALFIFLKFMNSVLPTLEFDYSMEITMNK